VLVEVCGNSDCGVAIKDAESIPLDDNGVQLTGMGEDWWKSYKEASDAYKRSMGWTT
jgi:hypothetical protein